MTAGNPKLSARKVLVSGMEAVYGVDDLANMGVAHGVLASNFAFTPMAATVTKRQRAYPTFGSDKSEITQKHATINFDIEASGSGAAGTAPLYNTMLLSCGMSETLSAGVSAVYNPISSNQQSSAHHFFYDSLKSVLTGTRGTTSLKISGGALPMWSFALTGLWAPATDAAPPDVHADLEAYIDAAESNVANTQFSLFGISAVLETLQIDLGNTVLFRDRPNAAEVVITDRAVAGSVTFEANTVATYDWMSAAAAKTTGALALTQGTTAGNEVQVAAPRVQLGNPTYADQNGVLCVTMPLIFVRGAGDDEISFTIK